MKRIININLFLLCISIKIFAQQDPMFSEYVFNGLVINPAYAGSHNVLSTSLLYRNQWVNVPGAPKTGIFSIDTPIRKPKVGLGLIVDYDKIGVNSHSGVTGIYSYKIEFPKSTLSFGLLMGIGFYNSNLANVNYSEVDKTDAAFQSNYHNAIPNFGVGAYYHTDRFYAGFSVPKIARRTIQEALSGIATGTQLNLSNHYLITSGYLFDLSPDMKLKPSFLLKYVNGAPVEMDFNGVLWFYDLVAIGISYRSLSSVDFMAQIRVNSQFYIGYAYEYATTNMNNFSNGSHEIMLQYQFDFTHSKIVTPRFF